MTSLSRLRTGCATERRDRRTDCGAGRARRPRLPGTGQAASRAETGQTRTGPSNDASGAGPLHGAGGADPASTAAPSRPHSKVRKPARRRARGNTGRRAEVVRAGKLELLLSDTGGLATSELADRVDADRDRVLTMLRELEMAGRVRRTGQRRSTRWHTITDEERIQNERRNSPHGASGGLTPRRRPGRPDWTLHSALVGCD